MMNIQLDWLHAVLIVLTALLTALCGFLAAGNFLMRVVLEAIAGMFGGVKKDTTDKRPGDQP